MDVLILAGGKSSRMGGKHKGNLELGGETFTQRLINEMSKISERIWISYGEEVKKYTKVVKLSMIYLKTVDRWVEFMQGLKRLNQK